jgi:hypothetical protein
MWAFEVRVRRHLGLKRVLVTLILLPRPTFADDVLFLGAAFEQTNGLQMQTVTSLREFTETATGATGAVDHAEYMGSFSIVVEVNCPETKLMLQVDLPTAPLPGKYFVLSPYPEYVAVEFPDGLRAYIGRVESQLLAQEIAQERFFAYTGQGKSDEPLAEVIEYETNQILYRHPDRLRFIAELLLARTCVPLRKKKIERVP